MDTNERFNDALMPAAEGQHPLAEEGKKPIEEGVSSERSEGQLDVRMRELQADAIIANHVMGAFTLGLLPIPVVDMAGVSATQLHMVKKLASLYGVPFSQELGRGVVSSLLGGILPAVSAVSLAKTLKYVPIIGFSVGIASMSVLGGAATYAVGQVFVRHFESGGTMLSLDMEKSREAAKKEFKQGKVWVGTKSKAWLRKLTPKVPEMFRSTTARKLDELAKNIAALSQTVEVLAKSSAEETHAKSA